MLFLYNEVCETNFSKFKLSSKFQSSSIDLNPPNNFIWVILKAKENVISHTSIEALKATLLKE